MQYPERRWAFRCAYRRFRSISNAAEPKEFIFKNKLAYKLSLKQKPHNKPANKAQRTQPQLPHRFVQVNGL